MSSERMKIRIGYGLGALQSVGEAASFAALVDGLEANGFDSLWLSERVSGPAPDPIIGLAMTLVILRITWQSWKTVRVPVHAH